MSALTGKAALAGVIGWPVSHSKSPALHGHWLDRYDIDGAYLPLPVAPKDLGDCLIALPKLGFKGINVTIPHKEAVMPLCATLTDRAKRIGAVNTITFDEDGKAHGDNTDGLGFMNNLHQSAPSWMAKAGPAIVLGAGGAARAVVVGLLDAGAPSVHILNRTVERAESLAKHIGGPVKAGSMDDLTDLLPDANLLANTTSLGMTGQPPLDVDLDSKPSHGLVTDIVYAPLKTDLLHNAEAHGLETVDGLGMLLHQAAPGFEAWFGQKPAVDDELRDAVLAA